MANQLKMAEVQAILALARHGWSRRRIARELGVHRETVGRYVKRPAGEDPKPASNAPPGFFAHQGPSAEGIGSAPGCSEPEGAPLGSGNLAGGSKPANNAPTGFLTNPSGPASAAGPWQEVILQKLQQGLDARRIYQDLAGDHGYGGSYYSVRRLVAKLTAFVDPPVRRMECAPGDEAQVDFGRGAPVVGPDGKRRLTWVFRIVLSHSRKGYSESVFRQTTDDFLRCLENAFQHFGGCPRTLVIDNLKAAVKQPDWFDPELCPKMRSFAEHYGIAILPTRPRTPRHKGKIERGIGYVKNNALKGRTFTSLAEQNRHLAHWEASVADLRIHGTTRQQVIGRFEQFEKPALLPLPPGRFALFAGRFGGHQHLRSALQQAIPELLLGVKPRARLIARAGLHTAVDGLDREPPLAQLADQVIQRVTELGKNQQPAIGMGEEILALEELGILAGDNGPQPRQLGFDAGLFHAHCPPRQAVQFADFIVDHLRIL